VNSPCSACPRKFNLLQPSGPSRARVFALGESPGLREDEKGQIFIGPAGEELNRGYLPLAGLYRSDICLQNTICCYPDRHKGKLKSDRWEDIELLTSCFNHNAAPMLDAAKPELILAMGAFACRALDPEIDLEMDHGIPRWNKRFETWVFPMFHPNLGMYEPKKMLHIRNDWVRLRKFRHKKLRTPKDSYAGWEDYQIVNADGVADTLDGQEDFDMASDTETMKGGDPFCYTYSTQPGTGYMVMADDTKAVQRLQKYINRWRAKILFHNWLFDFRVVTKMGLVIPAKKVVDTMVKVFALGVLPQGLKALVRRELGATMQDFDDLVRPYSKIRAMEYLMGVWAEEWEKPEAQMITQSDGSLKKYQPQSVRTKLKRFYTDYKKNPDKDPLDAWENWKDRHDEIEARCGEWPGMCITHAPLDEVIHYSCRDSDVLGRLNPRLDRMLARVRKTAPENWGDVR